MQIKKQQLEPDMLQRTGSKSGKEYIKDVYAEYIMQNAGLDESQAGIKIAWRNTITSDMQMTPPLWQKAKRTKETLDESERGE